MTNKKMTRQQVTEIIAAADMCDAYAASHPNALASVTAVADRWKENEND